MMTDSSQHLSDLLTETAARNPAREAIIFRQERISWGEVNRRVEALARAFLALGVQRGDRIGIMSTVRPEYFYTYLAAARVGATMVGFNMHYTAREIGELAALARPTVMVVLGEMNVAEQLQPLLQSLGFVRHLIAIGEPAPPGALRFEALAGAPWPEQEAAMAARTQTLDADDGALMVFSGGVNGTPKGAVLTHRNIIANIAAQNRNLAWRSDDRAILHLPMNHVSGATLIAIGALMSGATMVMLERFHPERTLEAVERERVTILGQVPTMFVMEFLAPGFADRDLSSLRMVIVSGAPTPEPVMRRIAALAPIAVHGYGLTEAAGMVTYTQPGDGLDRLLHSAGRVAPEFEVRIVDEARRSLPVGALGEVAVRGDCVMSGYFEAPAETAAMKDADGWLYTGDLGRLDDQGYLTVVGWRKEMYINGGYNVFPVEVEGYLNQHPAVATSACLSHPDDVMGQVGQVFVSPRPGAALRERDIRAYCKQGLARYKNPRYVHICDKLPLTAAGTVNKRKLEAESCHSS